MFMVGVFVAPQGFYKGGQFVFSFKVPQAYPHEPPKVKCETLVYHPNIDLEGNICLNILRLVIYSFIIINTTVMPLLLTRSKFTFHQKYK